LPQTGGTKIGTGVISGRSLSIALKALQSKCSCCIIISPTNLTICASSLPPDVGWLDFHGLYSYPPAFVDGVVWIGEDNNTHLPS